jgi:hypothetical protein
MKIEEARQRILAEWQNRLEKQESNAWTQKFQFYTWLERERPELLAFKCSGDKWQRVNGWIS